MEIKEQIAVWKEALLSPNQNDVLVNLVEDKNAVATDNGISTDEKIALPEDRLLNTFFKKHKESIKESGTPIFGAGQNLIEFSLDQNKYVCPVFVAGCNIKKNRFNKTYEIEISEDFYLNPFLAKTLEIDQEFEEIADFEAFLNEKGLSFEIRNGTWLANFHPHRFVLLKELEQLQEQKTLSNNLSQLLGEGDDSNGSMELHEGLLFDADEDQLSVFEKLKNENLVVQGPPGTGKSQVIGNLLGKVLGAEKQALLVAEKRVALEVIYDKLRSLGLHQFCLLYHHELKSKDFIRSLKSTWQLFEKRKKGSAILNLNAKLQIDGLELTLNRLRQADLIGGLSFTEFNEKKPTLNPKEIEFVTDVPPIPVWETNKKQLSKLKEGGFEIQGAWLKIKFKNELDFIHSLEKRLKEVLKEFQKLSENIVTIEDVESEIRKSGLVSLFFYDDLLIPTHLFTPDHKQQKRFLKLTNQLTTLKEKFETLEQEKKHWKKNFSLSELEEYISVLASTNRFNLRTKLKRRKLLKFTDLNLSDAKSALENLMACKDLERQIITTKEKLRELGVSTEDNELNHIQFVIRKIKQTDENVLKSLLKCSKQELVQLKNESTALQLISSFVNRFLELDQKDDVRKQLFEIKEAIPELTANFTRLSAISPQTKNVLRHTHNIENAEAIVYHSHWKKFTGYFPELAKFGGEQLTTKVENIISLQKGEQSSFADYIMDTIQARFETYHELLQTPARKLSESDKALKKQLRKGKSILVKAFGKTRNFPSVRDLLQSEAAPWIKLLHPLFLCSPYSVARSLPITTKFDLVIFDEASQIPLPHALGSVHRGERIVIAGDQQQMAPQFYFQKKSTQSSDLLHQASFYWKNTMLTNHYRSENADLIAFSNRYFYQNKLKPYPSFKQNQAIEVIQTDGTFVDRKNDKEAKIVSDIITEELKKSEKDFGLVAFSQTQLTAIIDNLSADHQNQLLEEEADYFVQSLENVQGDQCNHLIISMGYAPNEEGDFHMRFGPLNQEQGHRRLNVLMSRAKSKITFVRSVKAEDFSISDNDGVELLRKLMLFLEEEHNDLEQQLGDHITLDASSKKLTVRQPQNTFDSSVGLVNFYNVMVSRGWDVGFLV
ncbi:MAG: hypothetical protein COA32_14745 [Fluviicola sp.]|nr:MAG: hypothetical protein COA32_14745 [Fluviicola sp.]